MNKIFALALVLAGLLGAAHPTLAAPAKQKPMKVKPIEKTRRHLHRESMTRVRHLENHHEPGRRLARAK